MDGLEVQGAPGPAREARSIQEDARTVDEPRAGVGVVAEDTVGPSLGVALEPGRLQRGRQRADVAGLVLAVEVGADRAAAVAEVFGRLGQDALAATAPDARPVRSQERRVEPPDGVAVVDLLHRRPPVRSSSDRCG